MANQDFIPLPEHDDFEPDLRRAFEFAHHNVDPALVDHSKVKIEKDNILVSGDGAFYTLQGEGPTMGFPCVFFRLHVCNLRCSWCDAFYTWNPASEEFWTESRRLSFQEAADLIRKTWDEYAPEGAQKTVIFTGGEPLIQKKQIDQIMLLLNGKENLDELTGDEEEWLAEFETNGTLMPTKAQLWYGQFNVSPKLKNSDNNAHQMIKPKIIEKLASVNSTFKFVCETEEDLKEVEETYLPHININQLIIMPQGIRSEEIDKNLQALYEPCMRRGYRLLGRLQAQFADGARRQV